LQTKITTYKNCLSSSSSFSFSHNVNNSLFGQPPTVLGNLKPGGQFIILHIKMSNRAKGIAQKPSEPRVHIKDEKGNSWSFSAQGQKELDNLIGNQIPIDQKLELHQSVETQVVFDIPQNAKKLYALIEEGPFITNLLLQDDKQVFLIH